MTAKLTKCATCGAEWIGHDLMKPGNKFGNACCQGCGFDERVHGGSPRIFTAAEFEQSELS